MIKTIAKIIITVSVVGAGVLAVKTLADKKEKETATTPVVEEEDSRIKAAVQKKVAQILGFVATHTEQIEAISTIIGLGTGMFGIMSAFRDWRKGNDTEKKLDDINKKLDQISATQYRTNKVAYHNNMVMAVCFEEIAKASGVDMEKLDKTLCEVCGE